MREILFRGKSFHTKEWVEGYLGIEVPDELVIQQFSFDDYFNSDCIDQHRVKPETVGQYTGLKDKNGKKIFEGDIIKHSYRGINEKVIIRYGAPKERYTMYGWYLDDNRENTIFLLSDYFIGIFDCVIIGNIYDNPELLK